MLSEFLVQEVAAPSPHERELAHESSLRLAQHILPAHDIQMQIVDELGVVEILSIPAPALQMFSRILYEMGQGNALTLIPIDAELTTNQAADLLNVSRPYLIRLLEAGKIPFHRVGTHRRLYFKDLRIYKQDIKEKQRHALQDLADEAQELGLGY